MNASLVPQIFDRKAAASKWRRARARQKRTGSASYLTSLIVNESAWTFYGLKVTVHWLLVES